MTLSKACAIGIALRVNLPKIELVLFAKRKRTEGLVLHSLNGTTIKLSVEVKYLGVTLNDELLWSKHFEDKVHKAMITFGQYQDLWQNMRP